MSRSSVHRYCTGQVVPVEFGPLERLARACGATRAELIVLHRLWLEAGADAGPEPDRDPGGSDPGGAPPGRAGAGPAVAPQLPAPGPTTAPARRSAAGRGRLLVLAVVLLAVAAVTSWIPAPASTVSVSVSAGVPGVWTEAPRRIPAAFFGVTLNSASGAMPGYAVGGVRLWDSRTRWANIETEPDRFDWQVLDRLVAGAAQARLPVLFVVGGTPQWADPPGPLGPYGDGSRTSPPRDPARYARFVRAVAERYRGRIAAYQLWSIADDPRFYSGTQEALAGMSTAGADAVAAADPAATVVCPARTRLGTPEGQAALLAFAAAGGYQRCDVAAVNLYTRDAGQPPEALLVGAAEVTAAFHRAAVHPPIWDTGTTYDVALEAPLDPVTARDHAARFFLVGLYARYERMYLYAWGSDTLPIPLQVEGRPPTTAAFAMATVQRWVAGSRLRSCGHGAAATLPDNAWKCDFLDDAGSPFSVAWTETATAAWTPPAGAEVEGLDGPGPRVGPGEPIALGGSPVLIHVLP